MCLCVGAKTFFNCERCLVGAPNTVVSAITDESESKLKNRPFLTLYISSVFNPNNCSNFKRNALRSTLLQWTLTDIILIFWVVSLSKVSHVVNKKISHELCLFMPLKGEYVTNAKVESFIAANNAWMGNFLLTAHGIDIIIPETASFSFTVSNRYRSRICFTSNGSKTRQWILAVPLQFRLLFVPVKIAI